MDYYEVRMFAAEDLHRGMNSLNSECYRVRNIFQRPVAPFDFIVVAEFDSLRHKQKVVQARQNFAVRATLDGGAK